MAQLARRLAEKLKADQKDEVHRVGGLDEHAAEAAGLAHDLGHPPFGHIAEDELNKAVRTAEHQASLPEEGFEGNAQSLDW